MKLGYILLCVEDVVGTVEFYEQAFGLKRKLVHEDGYAELDTGATTLGFVAHKVAEATGVEYAKTTPEGPAPAVEIALVTDDVPGALEQAVRAGARVVAEPVEKPWGQTVGYVRDPNGFAIELCTPLGG